jgi:TRAP-type transport system periplasmic protein
MTTRRDFNRLALSSLAAAATAAPAFHVRAQARTIEITVASSHPKPVLWVGGMSSHFIPEVDRLLKEGGDRFRIQWKESYGGQLFKPNATLSSAGQGITDISWVFSGLEASKLPLYQVTTVTPFVTDNLPVILDVMNALHDSNADLRREWDRNNVVFLGASGNDSYDLYMKQPVRSLADLRGRKVSAPSALAPWLKNTGAVLVEGGLTSYYTDIQTGVSEGAISMATGIMPVKVFEVAPFIVRVNLGSVANGAMAINKDRFNSLPREVQDAFRAAGRVYSRKHAVECMARREGNIKAMVEAGARQTPPVQVIDFPAAERAAWIKNLPPLGKEWATTHESRGGRRLLAAYMDGLRAAGQRPERQWDKE